MGSIGHSLQQAGELAWRVFQAVNTRLPESRRAATRPWAPGTPPQVARAHPAAARLSRARPTRSAPAAWWRPASQILRGERDALRARRTATSARSRRRFYEKDNADPGHARPAPTTAPSRTSSRSTRSSAGRSRARFPGRDFRTLGDELVHRHGTSTIRYGRGAVLTIDLTNRCNMMCNPCFMDANQVGYVHELTLEEVKQILDDSISFKPRRQMSVQYSGGEPTHVAALPRGLPPTPRRSATSWCRRRPTGCASRSSRSSPTRPRRPASTWSTSSSTA